MPKYLLCSSFQRATGIKIDFKSFKIKGKQFFINDIYSKGDIDIKIPKTQLGFSIDLKNLQINTYITLFSPKIILKNEDDLKLNFFKKNPIFKTKVKIEGGEISLDKINVGFDLQDDKNSTSLHLFCDGEKKVKIDHSQNKKNSTTNFEFFDVNLKKIYPFLKFAKVISKNINNLEGKLNGTLKLQNAKENFFFDLKFENLKLHNDERTFAIQRLTLKGISSKIQELNLKSIASLKASCSFEGGVIYDQDIQQFSNLKGDIFIDPKGSRINLLGNEGSSLVHCKLEAKENRIDSICSFDEGKVIYTFENGASKINLQNLDLSYLKPFKMVCKEKIANLELHGRIDGTISLINDDLHMNCTVDKGNFNLDRYEFNVNKLNISSNLNLKNLQKMDLDLSVDGSSLKLNFFGKDKMVKELSCSLKIKDGAFAPSFISGSLEGLKSSLKIDGSLDDIFINAEIRGPTKDLCEHGMDDELNCLITCKKRKDSGYFSLMSQVDNKNGQKEHLILGMNFKDFKKWDLNGWLKAEKVILDKWNIFLSPKCKMAGTLDLVGSFQKRDLNLQMKGDLNFEDENQKFIITKIDTILAHYDFDKEKWSAKIPSVDGSYFLKKNDLNFVCERAKIEIDDKLIEFDLPKVISHDMDLKGKVVLDLNGLKLDIITNKACGKIKDLKEFCHHFGLDTFEVQNLDGTFTSNDRGFFFSRLLKEDSKIIWGINLCVKDLSFLYKNILTKVDLSFTYDGTKNYLQSELLGDIKIANNTYKIFCPRFLREGNDLKYDFRISDEMIDLIRIDGNGSISNEDIDLIFSSNSHFLNEQLNVHDIKLDKSSSLKSLKAEIKIDTENLISKLKIDKYGLTGNVLASIDYEKNKNFIISLKSDDLNFKGKKIEKFLLNGHRENEKFLISEMTLDDLKSNFLLNRVENGLKIENFLIQKKDSQIGGEGTFFTKDLHVELNLNEIKIVDLSLEKFKNCKTSIEGKGWATLMFENFDFETDLDLSSCKIFYDQFSMENNGTINLYFSNKKGWRATGVDLIDKESLLRATFKDAGFDIGQNRYFFKNGKVHLPLSLLSKERYFFLSQSWLNFDKDPEFSLDLEYFPKEGSLKSFTKEAVFFINNEKREIKDLSFFIEKNRAQCNFLYLLEDRYHPILNKIDFTNLKGECTFGGKKDSLTIFWKGEDQKINIERIKGNYSGLDLEFYKSKDEQDYFSLFGRAKVNFEEANSLFIKEIKEKLLFLNLKSGYEFKGEISLSKKRPKITKVRGDLIGKDFEIYDYVIKTLFANIDIEDDIVKIENLKISDLGGILNTDKITFSKKENQWFVDLPSLKIIDFCPSLLKRISNLPEEIKPFKVKEFSCNLNGNLQSLNTLTGSGSFSFINSFKRDFNVIEVPADVLGRIMGLDLELLIPVKGEVFFEIKDKKFLVSKINDVYSENKRSKFFLVGSPYMDFDGNLDIDIKMKQYVLLKITEKFILSVKGNIKDPQISLEKKKLLFKH